MNKNIFLKFIVFLSAMILVLSAAGCGNAPGESGRESGGPAVPAEDKFLMTFGAFGDKHVPMERGGGSTAHAHEHFKATLEYYMNNSVDTLLMVGDIADYTKYESNQDIGTAHNEVKKIMREVWGDDFISKPSHLLYTLGNHEFCYNIGPHRVLDEWGKFCEEIGCENKFSIEKGCEKLSFEVEGVTFISVDPFNEQNATKPDIKKRIEQECAAAAEKHPGYPIFLTCHILPKNTVLSEGWFSPNSIWFDMLMEKYPQIVLITGHTHYSVRHPQSINQRLGTVLNTGAGTYASVTLTDREGRAYDNVITGSEVPAGGDTTDENPDPAPGYADKNEGLLVDVYTKHVEVRRLDLTTGEDIAAPWSFPTALSRSDFVYTTAKMEEDLVIPELSEESCKVNWNEFNQTRLHFDLSPAAPTGDNIIDSYRIEVYESGSLIKDKNYISDYWKGTDGYGKYEMLMPKSAFGKALTVKIKGTDGMGRLTNEITVEVPAAA